MQTAQNKKTPIKVFEPQTVIEPSKRALAAAAKEGRVLRESVEKRLAKAGGEIREGALASGKR